MLFGNSDEHHGGWLRRVRDIVEIVAIIAAGLWAAWIFIYEDKIVPAQAEPQVNITETIEKISEHNGLIGVHLVTTVKNNGTVPDYFLAFFWTVAGQRITPAPKLHSTIVQDYNYYLAADYDSTRMTPVYTRGFITDHGNKDSGAGFALDPGDETKYEDLFYVKAGQFDVLRVYVLARYTRNDRIIPTAVRYRSDGMLDFTKPHDTDVHQIQNFPASLDLH